MKVILLGSTGYIGSMLGQHLIDQGYFVRGIDIGWFPLDKINQFHSNCEMMDYKNLSWRQLQEFDVVILLAGHSSVAQCENNLLSAFSNNVKNFVNLIEKLNPKQKFIFASSASVYGYSDREFTESSTIPRARKIYDLTKQSIDEYIRFANCEWYSLRFGTLSGYSLNLRTELLLNSMSLSAINNKIVKLSNPKINRSVLGMKDLCTAIAQIIKNSEDECGYYNLASVTDTMEGFAVKVAKYFNVPINILNPSPTYNFKLNCDSFKALFNWQPQETVESIIQSLEHVNIAEVDREKYTRNKAIIYDC